MKNDYDIAQIYREMELHLISSMQRNLGRHLKDEIAEGKEWKMWQAEKLKELKRYQRQNKDIVDFYTSGLSKDVSDILKEEFKQGHKSEINKYNKLFDKQISDSFFKLDDRKANALIKVVNHDLDEANKAVLRMMNDTYRQTIHKAATFANTGVMTQKQAVDMATKDFLNRGLAVIEYKDGKRVNIASYAQMAVRTASQRAMLMGEGEFRKSIGETNVIISKHGTACKLCVPHEGKVYIDNVYSGGKPDGKHKLLSDAMKQGLFHPNCRHGISTYYGLDDEEQEETTVNVPEENNNEDAARLDREIQKEKRKVAGFQSPDNLKTAQQRLKELEAKKQELVREYKPSKFSHEDAGKMKLWDKIKKDPDKYKNLIPTGDTARKLTEDDIETRLGDLMLKEIAKEQGFDALPKVVSSAEMDKLIKDGAEPIYRGLQSVKYCNEFMNGEYYAGLGMYGNGNYFVGAITKQLDNSTRQYKEFDGLELATAYAGNNEKGGIVRAVLDPKAKIINWNIIDDADSGIYYNDKTINYNILDGEKNQYGMVLKPTETDTLIQSILHYDEGRWAAYAGYDAIYVPSLNYYAVLNRSAVIVDETVITLKEEGEKISAIIGNGTKRTFNK